MRQSFIFNVAFLIFVNLLIKPFWVFGIDRSVQNIVGEETYGIFFAVFNFTYFFQIFLDFGLQQYVSREIGSDNEKLGVQIYNLLIFKGFMSLLYALITGVGAYFLGYLQYKFIWWLLLNQILLSAIIFLRSNIAAYRKFITDALLSVLDKIIMIIISTYFIWGIKNIDILTFVKIQSFAFCISFFICLWQVLILPTKIDVRPDLHLLRIIAISSLPYAAIHFLMTIYYRIDGVMIEKLLGDEGAWQSGVYAQGYRIMEALNNIGYLISIVLLPLFSYYYSQRQRLIQYLHSGFTIMWLICNAVVIILFVIKDDMISMLYQGMDLEYSSRVFGILLLNFFPVGLLYVVSTLLTAAKTFRFMITTLIVAVFLNIGLNYVGILKWGAMGAAYATFITQSFMLIVYSVQVVKDFDIHIRYKHIIRYLAYPIVLMLLAYFAKSHMNVWVFILLMTLATPVFAFLSGLLHKDIFKLSIRA
jgi:O-antigen/teichoic acid export membrane protein